MRRRLVLISICATLAIVACGRSGASVVEMAGFAAGPPATEPGGFEVGIDGLSFANYASVRGYTVRDAVEMFGDESVCGPGDGTCVVDARAMAWIETVSASMSGGVCEGMVLLALDRFMADAEPASTVLVRDEAVESRIAQLFATQFLPSVGSATMGGHVAGMSGLVQRVEQGLSTGGDPVTIGVYSNGAGHSLLPVAIDRLDGDRVIVGVYDVNWPGAPRVLEIDLAAETWRYSIDGADQANDPAAWVGGPGGIDLTPLSARADLGSGPFAVEPGRSVLTVTFRGSGWSVTSGDQVIDSATAMVGEAGLLAVGRGARQTTTLVIDAAAGLAVSTPGVMQFGAQTPSGWFTAEANAGGTVEVDPERAEVRIAGGSVTVTTATDRGMVEIEGFEGVSATVTDSSVVIDGLAAQPVVAAQPVGQRTDWALATDGVLVPSSPLQMPSDVRAGTAVGGSSGQDSAQAPTTPPMAGSTVPSTGPTSVAASVVIDPASTTSTTAPGPVTTPSPVTTAPGPVTTPSPATTVPTATTWPGPPPTPTVTTLPAPVTTPWPTTSLAP